MTNLYSQSDLNALTISQLEQLSYELSELHISVADEPRALHEIEVLLDQVKRTLAQKKRRQQAFTL